MSIIINVKPDDVTGLIGRSGGTVVNLNHRENWAKFLAETGGQGNRLEELEPSWLRGQGATGGDLHELWNSYLGLQGYTTLGFDDNLRVYFSSGSALLQTGLVFRPNIDTGAYYDGAISFVAANQEYLYNSAEKANFNLGTANFAFNLWIKRGGTGAKVFATKYQDANNYWEFGVNASDIAYFIAVIGGSTLISVTGTTAITSTTTWNNLHFNIDRSTAGNCKIYLNNADDTVAGAATSASTINNTGQFQFGANGALTNFCSGSKDQLGIWIGSKLTTGDITTLYNSGNGQVYSGISSLSVAPSMFYSFNEEGGLRYNIVANANHLLPTSVQLINLTTLNGGFETLPATGGGTTNIQTATRLRLTNVATLVTAINHNLANNDVVTIAGMGDATYNGVNKVVTVINATTFTYPSTGTDELVTADTTGRIATDVFSNVTELTAGITTINAETSAPYAGTYAARIDVDAATSTGSLYFPVTQTVGHRYKLTYYAKVSDATGSPSLKITNSGGGETYTNQILTTSYVQYTVYFAPLIASGGIILARNTNVASKSLFIDNVTLESLGPISDAGIAAGLATDANFCPQYNGTNQYFSVADNATLDLSTGNFALFGAFNRDKIGQSTILSKYQDANNYYTLEINTGNVLTFRAYIGGVKIVEVIGTQTLTPGNWYIYSINVDRVTAANCKIYINNIDDTSGTPTTAATDISNTGAFEIGRYTTSLYFGGRHDTLGLTKRVMTVGEITAFFNGGKCVKFSGLTSGLTSLVDASLVSVWDFDKRLGITVDSYGTNTLTNNGTVTFGQGVNYMEGVVAKVLDLSTASKTFTQTTQSKRPAWISNVSNGKPMLRFDGVDDRLDNATDVIGTGDITVFAVINPIGWGAGNNGRIISNGQFALYVNSTNTKLSAFSDGSTAVNSANGSITLATYYVVCVTRTAAGVLNFYINGVANGTADQSSGTPAAGTATYIGDLVAKSFDGYLAGLLTYSSILTTTQITAITNFLRGYYSI